MRKIILAVIITLAVDSFGGTTNNSRGIIYAIGGSNVISLLDGDIELSGTVDGRDVAVDGLTLDTNTTSIATNTVAISNLMVSVDLNSDDISLNFDAITQLEDDVGFLEEDLDALELIALTNTGPNSVDGSLTATGGVYATSTLGAGIAGTQAGALTIVDQATGFAAQNITSSNGVIRQISATETNIISKQICELSFIEGATQEFTGSGGYQIVTNLAVNYTDGACLLATTTGIWVNVTGYYRASQGVSFEVTTGAAVMEGDLYADEADVEDIAGQEVHWKETFTVTANTAYKGFSRMVFLTAGQFISLRVDPSTSTETAEWFSGNLSLELIRQ